MSAGLVRAVVVAVDVLGAEVCSSTDMAAYAAELAAHHWPIFPLRGKTPAIPGAHPLGDPLHGRCRGECGRHGHGVLDATSDVAQVAAWWSGSYRGANIGIRVPAPLAVLDVDPRHGGDQTLQELVASHGPIPPTLTAWSGRGDGGRHLYFRRPLSPLSARTLPGIDLKTSTGYVVAPPSVHPETGGRYRWEHEEALPMPRWLQAVLAPPRPVVGAPARPRSAAREIGYGDSIADTYSAEASWCDLLPRHGWSLVGGDGDSDGSRWRHPTATAAISATVRHGCLFVYSHNTPFPVTEAEAPAGVTRFRALAILDHGGDLSAAARAVREGAAR